MKKTITIICCVAAGIILIAAVIFLVNSNNLNKLVCESGKADITIIYDGKEIKGYTAKGLTYDLSDQQEIAKKIGVDAYLNEFEVWFNTNTNGTCTRK